MLNQYVNSNHMAFDKAMLQTVYQKLIHLFLCKLYRRCFFVYREVKQTGEQLQDALEQRENGLSVFFDGKRHIAAGGEKHEMG